MPGEAEHGTEVEEDEDEEVSVRCCFREGMGDFSESGFRGGAEVGNSCSGGSEWGARHEGRTGNSEWW